MPWKAVTVMSQRKEFVSLASAEDANISELCRRFDISRKTGYKWIERFRAEGESGIADRSRRPKSIPIITPQEMERAIVRVRNRHRCWGGRKICRRLTDLGWQEFLLPARSQAFSDAMACLIPKNRANTTLGNGLKLKRPTIFGKWILKGM